MKIAICGLGPGGTDVPEGWEKWCILGDRANRWTADLVFEVHWHQRHVPEDWETKTYWQYPSDPPFVQYPLERVIKEIGRDWFDSSMAYMMAMAIMRKPAMIGLFGVHQTDEWEFMHQRPNLSWLIGLAEGRGIKVHLPEGCKLLKHIPSEQYPVRYGYLAET